MSKQVTIFLSRKITLNRSDKEGAVLPAVELAAGRNVVDPDVAAHPFVKHHTYEASASVDAGEVEALRVRISELEEHAEQQAAHIRAANAQLNARAEENDAALRAANAASSDAEHARARIAELEKQVAAKDADMAALVASMTPADPAKAKGK
jgi:uncharacterized coiled-coil protein SlyX